MRVCASCGFDQNRDTASFCARCGKTLGSGQIPSSETEKTTNYVQTSEATAAMSRQAPPATAAAPVVIDSRLLLPEGTVLQERYRVVRVLGKGGMGAVYLVEDLALYGKRWALKELLERFTDAAEREEAIEQFRREVQMLVSLRHPNLPEVVNAFDEEGRHYIVMEYIEGKTLQELLNATPDGVLPEEAVLGWASQICDVLNYLHRHDPPIVFRDLKPANIMVTPEGQIKLIDFGVARLFDPSKGTDTLRMGTVGYAPPEQYSGQGQTTPRSDIYALGATLYDLLTTDSPEAHPFVFESVRRLNRQVSPPTARAIERAVQLDPKDRYPSVTAFRQALLEQKRRIPAGVWLAAAPVILALVAGGGWLLAARPWQREEPTPTVAIVAEVTATASPTATPAATSTPMPTFTPTQPPVTDTPTVEPTETPSPTPSPSPSPTPGGSPTPTTEPEDTPATSTPSEPTEEAATEAPTVATPLPGEMGRIVYTIDAGTSSYLGTTDPSWSQGQILGPTSSSLSTCSGGATAKTLDGTQVNMYYGYRCGIGFPKECPSPTNEFKVNLWKGDEGYIMTVVQTADGQQVQAPYTGRINEAEPLLWAPDGSYYYWTINQTLHRASPFAGGYEPVIPLAQESFLSPDGSMILYLQPVGSVGAYDVFVANADGSNPRNVTNTPDTYKLCARWGGN